MFSQDLADLTSGSAAYVRHRYRLEWTRLMTLGLNDRIITICKTELPPNGFNDVL